mgnify:CR=1 FL=1
MTTKKKGDHKKAPMKKEDMSEKMYREMPNMKKKMGKKGKKAC